MNRWGHGRTHKTQKGLRRRIDRLYGPLTLVNHLTNAGGRPFGRRRSTQAPSLPVSQNTLERFHCRKLLHIGDARVVCRSRTGAGQKNFRSDSAMATSLMLASRRRIKPCSSNSHSSLP